MPVWILLATAAAADWNALFAADGWSLVSETTHADTGPIRIDLKVIGGVQCLKGSAKVAVPADKLHQVVTDIPSAKKWSSETLLHSRVLAQNGKTTDYFQLLDVPGWTMASDRFWVLRGEDTSTATQKAFRWDRFEWQAKHPEIVAEAAATGAVEPIPNWGAWVFEPSGADTQVKYYICSDPGGSIPTWLKETAATKTLPNTVADVVREGRKRAKS